MIINLRLFTNLSSNKQDLYVEDNENAYRFTNIHKDIEDLPILQLLISNFEHILPIYQQYKDINLQYKNKIKDYQITKDQLNNILHNLDNLVKQINYCRDILNNKQEGISVELQNLITKLIVDDMFLNYRANIIRAQIGNAKPDSQYKIDLEAKLQEIIGQYEENKIELEKVKQVLNPTLLNLPAQDIVVEIDKLNDDIKVFYNKKFVLEQQLKNDEFKLIDVTSKLQYLQHTLGISNECK